MTTYLTRTPASTTDAQRKTWTYSVWVKPSNILSSGNGGEFAYIYQYSGGSSAYVRMDSNYKLRFRDYTNGGSPDSLLSTDALFRDPSAWYHIVLRHDTTQATAADRVRLYVNGTQISFAQNDYPAQDALGFINSTFPAQIGESSSNVLRGSYLSQAIMCAGQSYAPTAFGSTNANGVWVPNTSPSVTYGTNGFKLDFAGTGATADASGFGADTSGNNNHFATTNIATNPNIKDTPQNIFATLNSLANSSYTTLSIGNLKTTGNNAGNNGNTESTIAVANGKWYWEHKMTTSASPYYPTTGIVKPETVGRLLNGGGNAMVGVVTDSVSYEFNGNRRISNTSTNNHFASLSNGDIVGIALDMDNGAVYFSKNGTFQNSSDPTSGSNKTNAAHTWTADGRLYMAATASYNSSVAEINFGNPAYTITSGNADANGYGNFEYAVPSGFYALCTKNLAQYG